MLGPPIIGGRIVEATGGRVAGFRVELLGGFRVTVEGRPVDAIANPDAWADDIEETQRDEAKDIFGTWKEPKSYIRIVLHPSADPQRRGWLTALATGASATVAA